MTRARRLKAAYDKTKAALRAEPDNKELRSRLAAYRNEYEALRQQLAHAGQEREGDHPAVPFDPSQFEPEPTRVKPPVVENESWMERAGGVLLSFQFWRMTVVLGLFVVTGFIFILIQAGDVGFYQVPTNSMVPTFYPGDHIVGMRQDDYRRGDVVVLTDRRFPGDFLTKRIVALPGDTVAVEGRQLYVNGIPIAEPYIPEPMEFSMGPITVGRDEVFVLGDNRNASEDSSEWGRGLPMEDIAGKVVYIYRPAERRGRVTGAGSAFSMVP